MEGMTLLLYWRLKSQVDRAEWWNLFFALFIPLSHPSLYILIHFWLTSKCLRWRLRPILLLYSPMPFMQVLLRKGSNKDTQFIHAPTGCYDNELFTIIWGPTIAALSFVFDKSHDQSIVQKAIMGFRWEKFGKCEEVLHLWDRSTSAISLIDHFETRPWFNIVYLTD